MLGLLIWGKRNYGTTDQVPGIFHIETNFFHIWFVPLFPLKTFLILGPDRGVQIPVSSKSVWAVYLRLFSVLGLIVSWITMMATIGNANPGNPTIPVVSFVLVCGLCYFAFAGKQLQLASYERAIELCSHLGAHEDHYKQKIDQHFHKIDGVVAAEAIILEDDVDQEDVEFQDETGVQKQEIV